MRSMEPQDSRRAASPPAVESLDEVKLARRSRIVQAAIRMMTTTEYDRIQMKDVTALAGVALGTTYRYFSSKDHLFSEALLTWADRFPTQPPAPGRRSVDQLKVAYHTAVRAFEPHPTVYGTIVVLQASSDPYTKRLFDEFATRQEAAFARYLPRISSPRREQIVSVMSAVLDTNLRIWAVGRRSIERVHENINSAAELLLSS